MYNVKVENKKEIKRKRKRRFIFEISSHV